MAIHKLKNITYELHKMEKALVFQILEQDESWRRKEKLATSLKTGEEENLCPVLKFKASNGLLIRSTNFPSLPLLKHNIVDVRGTLKQNDLWVCVLQEFALKSNIRRDKHYNKIIEALKEWDLYVEQLKEKKQWTTAA